jgi:hypothetical protein
MGSLEHRTSSKRNRLLRAGGVELNNVMIGEAREAEGAQKPRAELCVASLQTAYDSDRPKRVCAPVSKGSAREPARALNACVYA